MQKPQPDFSLIKEMTEHMTGGLKDRPYVDELLDLIQEEEKVSVGKTIPYVNLPNAKGTQISRTSFKDKYLLIHFWASWDPQSPAPDLQERRKEQAIRTLGHFLGYRQKGMGRSNQKRYPEVGTEL